MASEITGGEALIARLGRVPAQVRSLVEQAVIIGAGMVEEDAKNNIRENGSVVSGNLFQSVGTTMTLKEDEITALVGTAGGYASAYEFGMAASEGDFDTHEFYLAILDWVRIKHIGGDTEEEQTATAFFITEHIREYGTQPHPFLIPAYQKNQETIKALLEKAVRHPEATSVS